MLTYLAGISTSTLCIAYFNSRIRRNKDKKAKYNNFIKSKYDKQKNIVLVDGKIKGENDILFHNKYYYEEIECEEYNYLPFQTGNITQYMIVPYTEFEWHEIFKTIFRGDKIIINEQEYLVNEHSNIQIIKSKIEYTDKNISILKENNINPCSNKVKIINDFMETGDHKYALIAQKEQFIIALGELDYIETILKGSKFYNCSDRSFFLYIAILICIYVIIFCCNEIYINAINVST